MKLTVIDPHITMGSPSMRAWVGAFPIVRSLFDEVEIWASACEIPEGNGVIWKRIPRRLPTWPLQAMDFRRRVGRMADDLRDDPNRIVQVTGCLVKNADIRYIHYWNSAVLEEQALRPKTFPLPMAKRIPTTIAAKQEAESVTQARDRDHWWVVSRSLAERIESQGAGGSFQILPNQYDPARFHAGVRTDWREKMRQHYGFKPEERILVFSAFGHFERKGLRQGIEAVTELRRRGHPVRYLILGGTPATLGRFRRHLTAEEEAACVFTGLVDDIERHLVAADGLLFPSHFEAFSLSEIEAAALGLRLYLTRHYGSEMILREPVNGRWLPWEPTGMADAIEADLQSGLLGTTHSELGEAITPDTYANRLRDLYSQVIQTAKAR